MPPKRKRNTSVPPKGLAPGEKLKRNALPGSRASTPWGWVGSEVTDVGQITLEHRLAACNLSPRNENAFCLNRYSRSELQDTPKSTPKPPPPHSSANGELEDDIIVISDDEEEPTCSKKGCRSNPNCLNYVGQDIWEAEDGTEEILRKYAKLGTDPSQDSREADLPVGLKNLGATCYANASLQVWYRDLAFRSGVFSCEPPEGTSEEKYKDSPIFQLQVTFAALQEGNKTTFNPVRLVESLQLRTSEQQDAQEFSKLFMSHLDAEFKKQSSPAVKSLITDQFQGGQVYGTICHACKSRSERASDFLEIEISFENNSRLEERLAASLLPETLCGDNQYFCSRCEALRDATRYTELRQLPPVLHFSLLRFVYDISTMERKKSKHSISFPLTLDMHKFLGSKNVREQAMTVGNEEDLYELRGILLHKGTSAYHGHYEAQVNDVEHGSWFQFNDETVTRMKSLGDKVALKRSTEKPDHSQVRKNRMNARKRRRINDSDDEVIEQVFYFIYMNMIFLISIFRVKAKSAATVSTTPRDTTRLITSKDAYMLIYARKAKNEMIPSPQVVEGFDNVSQMSTKPPIRAMKIVRELNTAHDKASKDFREKETHIRTQFHNLRRKVREVYLNWAVNNADEDSFVVSRQALDAWLSEHCIQAVLPPNDKEPSESSHPISIPLSDIVCEHGSLDPLKSRETKRLSSQTFNRIVKTTNCTFDPMLKPSDACSICVSNIFKEKLYEIEHPRYTKRFEKSAIVLDDDEMGYWISKKWCKDWKLIKPRMHVDTQVDPAPDSSEFYNHVYCEHGGLSLNTTNRRKISLEAVELLQELYPSWQPPSTDTETCAVCDAEVHISKEDKKEFRRQAEEEKARLKFIYQSFLDAWADSSERTACAVVPSQFIRNWRRWVNNPSDHPRPTAVDNKPFFCEHDLLIFDPNCFNDLDSSITIIERDNWDILQSIYNCGPLIALTRESDQGGVKYGHNILVCEGCRMKRKTEWETADIIIHLCGPEGSHSSRPDSRQKPVVTYGRGNGARQSKRLRQIKEHGERRRVSVSKTTTVKDIKILVTEEFNIPTICQRLFHQGRELEDNTATVATLQLLVNDVLDLREVDEILEIDSDSDERPPSKRRREGPAFGGTLLGATDSPWSSSPERTPAPMHTNAEEKPCIVCTYSNRFDAVCCEMCDAVFV
ncbi:hypothetical protein GALMADRAFT_72029 [Galerina marginata CBS 339.88]|uniref:Uncharacterized protein n=1 Tax=Galerina marginata (strain CBS 339.88) TaxID=685588 RepID=A0A067SRL8_GALM3|nr:hypothetical protein GALMADRAFT_72029 [Galerina marginata CBS 339.88]